LLSSEWEIWVSVWRREAHNFWGYRFFVYRGIVRRRSVVGESDSLGPTYIITRVNYPVFLPNQVRLPTPADKSSPLPKINHIRY